MDHLPGKNQDAPEPVQGPVTDLFCTYGQECRHLVPIGLGARKRGFEALLSQLGLAATCYFVGKELPGSSKKFNYFLEKLCSFLQEHHFCQFNVRPVHPMTQGDARLWVESYRHILGVCKAFHEEGYRHQIVSRLRIFPVLWLEESVDLAQAGSLLAFLSANFFLPSLIMTREVVPRMRDMEGRGGRSDLFERIYLTEDPGFEPSKAIGTLYESALLDRLLEQDRTVPIEPGICRGSVILGADGRTGSCLRLWDPRSEGAFPENGTAPHGKRQGCAGCVRNALARAAESYRLNGRSEEFGALGNRVGASLRRADETDAALEVWDLVSAGECSGETSLEVLIGRASCRIAKGELERAMEELVAAREIAPGSPEVRYHMGLCEFGWKDYIEAADRFLEAVRLGLRDPLRSDAEYHRGVSHYRLEEYDAALAALAAARDLGKSDSTVLFFLGLSWMGKGEVRKGLAFLLDSLQAGPCGEDLFYVLFYIGHAHKELSAFAEALVYLEKARSIVPESKEAANLMGFCHFKLKNYDASIRCFEKAIEIEPRSAIDYANIGSNLREKGDLEGAETLYRKALSLDPTIDFARESLDRIVRGRK
ncbi:MAG: tetratricopeptide repeat protein [bacterium]